MNGLKIAFDISQAGRRKAGCGFYADALLNGLLATDTEDEFTLMTSFGNFFHDSTQALAHPHFNKGVRYGPRHLRRKDAERFWENQEKGGRWLEQFDVVHANNFWCPPWPLPGKLIYTLYDMSFIDHPEWTTEKNRKGCLEGVERAAAFADQFVAISEATKRAFLHHFPRVPPEKVKVIYPASRFGQPGFNPKPKQPKQKVFSTGKPFFLSTGTIEPRKNQAFLLDVYNQFRDRGGDAIPLVLAGKKGWMMDDFEDKVARSPWAKDIHILGYVNDAELAWLYQHCLVNLYPSHYEGFGLPVLEGMGFGALAICSSSSSMPEVAGEAGIILPPDALNLWATVIRSMAHDSKIRTKLQASAKEQATHFSWRKSTQLVLNLYCASRKKLGQDVFSA
ncbi:glycosyltransferase family 4 protein [Synechococcus lacustris C3-12m-Tous]|uniref:glycosyltransferase family 4 protein n=1 Tax=Synechococcus lacustris TaxID=2116544 RepID=UPI0020CEDF1F|nr:glycosyltransferase family 1 protein [Synechococcus lacustris]MCP9926154.1 glycosyltransferase family 4 protein [Synechococcus lacustris C3-12m-Tous]